MSACMTQLSFSFTKRFQKPELVIFQHFDKTKQFLPVRSDSLFSLDFTLHTVIGKLVLLSSLISTDASLHRWQQSTQMGTERVIKMHLCYKQDQKNHPHMRSENLHRRKMNLCINKTKKALKKISLLKMVNLN